AGLFEGNSRPRLAQYLRMFEADIGDDGNIAVDDIGRIQPATETRLDHGPLNARIAENQETGRCQYVEPCCSFRCRPFRPCGLESIEPQDERLGEHSLFDRLAIQADTLGNMLHMRRGITPDGNAGM